MKKIILSLIFFGGFLFAQSNYEARLVIEDLYWHNQNEWAAHLKGELYLNGVLQVPSQEYYYHWQWKKEGEWKDRITSGYGEYTHYIDGNENSFFLLRLKITGLGFSALSEEANIGKNGTIQSVNINSYKEDGSSANNETKINFWATYKWLDNGVSNDFYFSLNQDNYVKDSIVSVEQFGQRFNKWVNNNSSVEYYTNHAGIYIDSGTNTIKVMHRTFKDATLSVAGDAGSVVKVSFKDPWLVETKPAYFEAPYGYRNLGNSAIFEEVDNGTNNIGINSIYKGVFLDQNPNFLPNIPNYFVSVPLIKTINGSTAFFTGWSASPSGSAKFKDASVDSTAVVFRADNATVNAIEYFI